jgi:uncharacterized repeat protein (TIGR01451 family)
MNKVAALAAVVFLSCSVLFADISVTDRSSTLRLIADKSALRPGAEDAAQAARHAAAVAANQAKRDAKRARQHAHGKGRVSALALHPRTLATGSIQLIDSAGLKYFINTNITFSTSSSASGAASEASYTHAVAATTSAGGVTNSTLNDEFDGYGAICVSLTNASGPCQTGNANFTMFNKNGPTPFDATVPPGPTCTNRQLVYGPQIIGGLSVTRKVFVPTNDMFIRWMNFFTNTTGSPITFTMITSNNLGSDSNTVIVNSSNGDAVAQTTDTWITSFQNYSGKTSSDVRTGQIIQGSCAATPVNGIFFQNGNDKPWWSYSITLAPGQTKAIVNFATGQPSKAAANAQSAALALLPASSTQCLSATELNEISNFCASADLSITKNTASGTAFGGNPITYTLSVSNLGPGTAPSVSVTDTLPAGSGFVSASGTGWTCNFATGTVTCTLPSLALGAANPITLTITAPPVASPGTLSNTATVSSAASDPNPANNSSTKSVPILPGNAIPALSAWMLMMLAAVLGAIALVRRT